MTAPKTFNSPGFQVMWDRCIKSHLAGHHLALAAELADLIDREGAFLPSIIESENPEEPDNWLKPNAFELLKQVSLVEHIAKVVEEAAKLITPRRLQLYRLLVLAALGSDISKLPCVPTRLHCHPMDSWIFVARIINGRMSDPERAAILLAIRAHHVEIAGENRVGYPLLNPLRRAHMNARVAELHDLNIDLEKLAHEWRKIPSLKLNCELSRGLLPDEAGPVNVTKLDCTEIELWWLDVDRFLEALAEEVDRCEPGDFAISRRRGQVYFAPHTLYRVFRKFALNNCWRIVLLYDGDPFERQRLLKCLVRKLYEAGAIWGNYPEVGMYYLIHFVWTGKDNYTLMPLISFNQSVFPRKILERNRYRPGWLAKVKRIWPVGEKGTSRFDFINGDALPEEEW